MSLSVVSFNFKTTPVELREKLATPAEQTPEILRSAREESGIDELMVLSTCNRVEFYLGGADEEVAPKLYRWLADRYQLSTGELERAAVALNGQEALTHLFRVAGSLESMVIGEPQVLGQVKDAFHMSVEQQAQGPVLTGLMPRVFRAAKRIRTETDIAKFPVSISFVAVELASRIFEDLADKTVMVIGAGEMAELTLVHLLGAGIKRLLITNRTFTRAVALAERFQGSAVRFEELGDYLPEADIIISSTGSPDYVITPELARTASKKRKGEPMFLIDIAVPRDIDPAVEKVSNVYSYNIDDLKAVADANKHEREREAQIAQGIVEEEVNSYLQWRSSLSVVPTVKALRQHFTSLAQQEAEKALERMSHLSAEDEKAVRSMVDRLVNKLLHSPSTRLKEVGDDMNGLMYADSIIALFDLQPTPDEGRQNLEPQEKTPRDSEDKSNVVQLPVSSAKL